MIKNKIFIVFFILIILLFFIFSGCSFASISYEGKSFPSFPEDFQNAKYKFICYYRTTGTYNLFFWNNGDAYFDTEEILSSYNDTNFLYIPSGYSRFEYNPESDSYNWKIISQNSNNDFNFYCWTDYYVGDTYLPKDMIYSNFDIYLKNSDELFFHKTPLLNFTNMQRTLGGNLYQTVHKTVITLVPVGLIILSTVLLIYLIASKKWFRT